MSELEVFKAISMGGITRDQLVRRLVEAGIHSKTC